jgi:hypothetical protein
MKLAAFLALAFCMTLGGCSLLRNMSDEDLANTIYNGSKRTAKVALKVALEKVPADDATIRADAQLAIKLIRENVVPLFSSTTVEVLRSTVDAILENAASQLSSTMVDILRLTINVAAGQINLPENPAAKLDSRTKGALLALFNGLADGAEAGMASVPVPTPTGSASKSAVEWAKVQPKQTLVWPKN